MAPIRDATAAQEAGARTRHLNIWVRADATLSSLRARQEATYTSLSLDDFKGQECHLGLDLASRTDLAAMAIVFPSRDADTGLLSVERSAAKARVVGRYPK